MSSLIRSWIERVIFRAAVQYRPIIAELSSNLARCKTEHAVVDAMRTAVLSIDHFATASIALEPTSAGIDRASLQPQWMGGESGKAYLSLPMIAHDRQRALLQVVPRDGAVLSSDDVLLLETASVLGALSLHHVEVLREQEKLRALVHSVDRAERSAALTTLASEVLHEIQTPLHFLRSVVASQLASFSDHETATIALDEAARLERLVAAARHLQFPQARRAPVSLLELAQTVARVLHGGRPGGRPIDIDIDPALTVHADSDRLRQIFVNLLRNAGEAARERTGVRAHKINDDLAIDFWDDGDGVAPAVRGELFRAFRSSKTAGMGMGLVVCAKLVREFGWSIDYERHDDRSVFRVLVDRSDVE